MAKSKMTSIEKEQWNKLYQYVKKEILMYDDAQSIPSSLVLRLKGLTKGKFIENKHIEDKANYSYETVLYAFQICKPKIMNAIARVEFTSETHKFNYICKIVENSINDVYIRMLDSKQSAEKTKTIDTDIITHKASEYKKKTKDLNNDRLENLW